jgi:hypothetical protein
MTFALAHSQAACVCGAVFAVPLVLKFCTEVIETYGIVDGVYRLSGIASNIQKLRYCTLLHIPTLHTGRTR